MVAAARHLGCGRAIIEHRPHSDADAWSTLHGDDCPDEKLGVKGPAEAFVPRREVRDFDDAASGIGSDCFDDRSVRKIALCPRSGALHDDVVKSAFRVVAVHECREHGIAVQAREAEPNVPGGACQQACDRTIAYRGEIERGHGVNASRTIATIGAPPLDDRQNEQRHRVLRHRA